MNKNGPRGGAHTGGPSIRQWVRCTSAGALTADDRCFDEWDPSVFTLSTEIITDENSLSLMHQNHLSDVLPLSLSLLDIIGSYAS